MREKTINIQTPKGQSGKEKEGKTRSRKQLFPNLADGVSGGVAVAAWWLAGKPFARFNLGGVTT